MHCPNCGATMLAGTFSVEGTFLRWLWVGQSWQSLWFRVGREGRGRVKVRALDPSDGQRDGWACRNCGTSVIPPA